MGLDPGVRDDVIDGLVPAERMAMLAACEDARPPPSAADVTDAFSTPEKVLAFAKSLSDDARVAFVASMSGEDQAAFMLLAASTDGSTKEAFQEDAHDGASKRFVVLVNEHKDGGEIGPLVTAAHAMIATERAHALAGVEKVELRESISAALKVMDEKDASDHFGILVKAHDVADDIEPLVAAYRALSEKGREVAFEGVEDVELRDLIVAATAKVEQDAVASFTEMIEARTPGSSTKDLVEAALNMSPAERAEAIGAIKDAKLRDRIRTEAQDAAAGKLVKLVKAYTTAAPIEPLVAAARAMGPEARTKAILAINDATLRGRIVEAIKDADANDAAKAAAAEEFRKLVVTHAPSDPIGPIVAAALAMSFADRAKAVGAIEVDELRDRVLRALKGAAAKDAAAKIATKEFNKLVAVHVANASNGPNGPNGPNADITALVEAARALIPTERAKAVGAIADETLRARIVGAVIGGARPTVNEVLAAIAVNSPDAAKMVLGLTAEERADHPEIDAAVARLLKGIFTTHAFDQTIKDAIDRINGAFAGAWDGIVETYTSLSETDRGRFCSLLLPKHNARMATLVKLAVIKDWNSEEALDAVLELDSEGRAHFLAKLPEDSRNALTENARLRLPDAETKDDGLLELLRKIDKAVADDAFSRENADTRPSVVFDALPRRVPKGDQTPPSPGAVVLEEATYKDDRLDTALAIVDGASWTPKLLFEHMGAVIGFIPTQTHRLHYGHLNEPPNVRRIVDLLVDIGRDRLSSVMKQNTDMLSELTGVLPGTDDKDPAATLEAVVKRFHRSDLLAVPYRFANVPSVGSEFSDPVLTIGYTIMSLLTTGLNEVRLHAIAEIVIRKHTLYHAAWERIYGYVLAPNRWAWVGANLDRLRHDSVLLPLYIEIMIPRALKVFEKTQSACGLDLVMSGTHRLRNGFTGTPEDIALIDINPIKVDRGADPPDEANAMAKLDIEKASADGIDGYIYKGKYDVIIDVGSVFLGASPSDILCQLINQHRPAIVDDADAFVHLRIPSSVRAPITQLAYWDGSDLPCTIDITGTVTPWDMKQTPGMAVYYDHAHTTGTDAVLMDDPKACITVRDNTTYRDFIQGLFRMRKIAKVDASRCTVIASAKLVDTKFQNGIESFKEWLGQNTEDLKKSQDPLRVLHNTMAFMRSQASSVTTAGAAVSAAAAASFQTVRSAYNDYLGPKNAPNYNEMLRWTLDAAIKHVTDQNTGSNSIEPMLKALLVKLPHDDAPTPLRNAEVEAEADAEKDAEAHADDEAQQENQMQAERLNQVAMMERQSDFNQALPFQIMYGHTPLDEQTWPEPPHDMNVIFMDYDHYLPSRNRPAPARLLLPPLPSADVSPSPPDVVPGDTPSPPAIDAPLPPLMLPKKSGFFGFFNIGKFLNFFKNMVGGGGVGDDASLDHYFNYKGAGFGFYESVLFERGHKKFRELTVLITTNSGERRSKMFKLTFPDGMLLINHMKTIESPPPNLKTLKVKMGEVVWYSYIGGKPPRTPSQDPPQDPPRTSPGSP